MTFLHPWALGFLALIPIIILLYLLKLKRESVVVPSLLFWHRVLRENRRRALFHRLRQWLSLLLHLLIFLLILLALLRPDWRGLASTRSSTLIILAAGAEMQAVEPGGVTRWEQALDLARGITQRATEQNRVAVLRAGRVPTVIAPFTDDEQVLQTALAEARPDATAADRDSALELATRLLKSRSGSTRLVIISPDQWEAPAEQLTVGSSLDNVGITAFSARPLLSSRGTVEVRLVVSNFSSSRVASSVDILLDEALIDVKPFDLLPGKSRTDIFQIAPPKISKGQLRARLDHPDALALDNEALAILPSAAPRRVLLITSGNLFLERVLAADETVQHDLLTPENFRPELARSFDAVIFDRVAPVPPAELETHALFIGIDPFNPTPETMEAPVVTAADDRHPMLRLVSLDRVRFLKMLRLTSAPEWRWQTPAQAGDQPAILAGVREGKRLAIFAFEIGGTDLPLRVAFPLLMSNTVEWVAGEEAAAPVAENAFGVSDLRTDGTAANTTRSPALSWAPAWPLWIWLALAALLLFTLEWWLFHTRRTE